MQSIADISIFKTPFESSQVFETKFERIKTMFEDYITNAWMEIVSEVSENDHYVTKLYFDPEKRLVEISFSFQKNLSRTIETSQKRSILDEEWSHSSPVEGLPQWTVRNSTGNEETEWWVQKTSFSGISLYFPAGIVNYSLNPFIFQKENIEHFLDDNIAFIWNVFATEFFIDYHSDYRIDDRNKGKKLDYDSLKTFDMENPKSGANKQLLDSLMYIYFGLMKSIYNLENNGEKLDQFLKNTTLSDIWGTFELFALRGDTTKDALISQARLIKGQIDAFVRLVR